MNKLSGDNFITKRRLRHDENTEAQVSNLSSQSKAPTFDGDLVYEKSQANSKPNLFKINRLKFLFRAVYFVRDAESRSRVLLVLLIIFMMNLYIKYFFTRNNYLQKRNDLVSLRVGNKPYRSVLCTNEKVFLTIFSSSENCEVKYPLIDIQDYTDKEELFDLEKKIVGNVRSKKTHFGIMDSIILQRLEEASFSNLSKQSNKQNNAIMTRRGFKGGDPNNQINQDRVVIISPFLSSRNKGYFSEQNFVMGIWDGHGQDGHVVADFVQETLPLLLTNELNKMLQSNLRRVTADLEREIQQRMRQILIDTFHTVDLLIPNQKESGCTSSFTILFGSKLYFANAGDSQTFLASFTPSKTTLNVTPTHIHYITRRDKPHLPNERNRIESMGGEVYMPLLSEDTSRVITYKNKGKIDESISGLAMSRSLGDKDAKKVGVVSDPLISIIDTSDILQNKKFSNDVFIVVAASDGLLDTISPEEITVEIAQAYVKGEDFSLACGRLIWKASKKWMEKGFFYRDDISLAIHQVKMD